jgi:outer membrane protein assembly factor BamB
MASAKAQWTRSIGELGMSTPQWVAAGDGVIVMVDSAGRLACLDIATGEPLWKDVTLVGGKRRPAGPPQIASGMVLLRHDDGRRMTCFNVADNGRARGKWQGNRSVEGCFAGQGLLAVMIDGTLSVYDCSQLAGDPLWTRECGDAATTFILAANEDYVAVAGGAAGEAIEVFPLIGGGPPILSLAAGEIGGRKAYPIAAEFNNRNLYVTCTVGRHGPAAARGVVRHCEGLGFQKIDLDKGRRAWQFDVDAESQPYRLLPLTFGDKHVVVSVDRRSPVGAVKFHVLDSRTGKVADMVECKRPASFGGPEGRRSYVIGQPVMTDGRLCVETMDGVQVYGG